jgi:hypothetical protein
MDYSQITIPNGAELFYSGPPLDAGPLPAIIYLAVSGIDSLILDPLNQPAAFLALHYKMRVFSLNLPAHEPPLQPQHAFTEWADAFQKGNDLLRPFIKRVAHTANFLVEKKIATKLGIAGLSRGGFLAMHSAALSSHLQTVLAFAPVTKLGLAKEFSSLAADPELQKLDLLSLCEELYDKTIRIYIGNRDELVSTSSCFSFVKALADTAYEHKIRSPQVEMILSPSIGYQGHGTAKSLFEQGAAWIADQLEAKRVEQW